MSVFTFDAKAWFLFFLYRWVCVIWVYLTLYGFINLTLETFVRVQKAFEQFPNCFGIH